MEPILTVQQMRELDKFVINRDDAAQSLMGKAGEALAEELFPFKKIAIVCGSGNNGGDGYAAAYALQEKHQLGGKCITIFYAKEPKSPESIFFFEGINSEYIKLEQFSTDEGVKNILAESDCIVDCLLGTGFSGVPRGDIKDAIEIVNEIKLAHPEITVLSMDINSGVNGDTGEGNMGVSSDITLSIGYKKRGMITSEFSKWSKKVVNKNIGYELSKDNFKPFDSPDDILWIE